MSWQAETVFGQFGIGTELGIFEQPWGAGLPVRSLPIGVQLNVTLGAGGGAILKVVEITGNEAVLQTSDKTKWRIVEVGAKGLRFPPPHTAGAPTTYWIVKEAIPSLPHSN